MDGRTPVGKTLWNWSRMDLLPFAFFPCWERLGCSLLDIPKSHPLFRSAEPARIVWGFFPTMVRDVARQSKRSIPRLSSCFSSLPLPKRGTQAGLRWRREGVCAAVMLERRAWPRGKELLAIPRCEATDVSNGRKVGWEWNAEGFSCSQKEREGHRCYCLVSQEDPNRKVTRRGLWAREVATTEREDRWWSSCQACRHPWPTSVGRCNF